MPLTNFGAILNFAESIEKEDTAFYQVACSTAEADCKEMFDRLTQEGKKHIAIIQRTRRENVTEMILEPIQDFERASYQLNIVDMEAKNTQALVAAAISLEERAVRYYTDAGVKMRALPEVARALKTLAKKRMKRLQQLERC